ncbi:hypothetical protein F5Y08DRAFT_344825 [Xylaria arbuscula]|nr:hypothetical protein F5Y08DRAFT_344825 [Xylaria arbuscula]
MGMNSTIGELRGQWANPSDILSLPLLIGGDMVQKAIAQLVFMPTSECPSLMVNCSNGFVRNGLEWTSKRSQLLERAMSSTTGCHNRNFQLVIG